MKRPRLKGGVGAVNLRGFLPGYRGGSSGERRVYPLPRPMVPVDSHESERPPSVPLLLAKGGSSGACASRWSDPKARVSSGKSRCARAVSRSQSAGVQAL